MIKFSINEMKLMRIYLKGDDYEPTEEELNYIELLGENRAISLLNKVENKLHKIINIRDNVKHKKKET